MYHTEHLKQKKKKLGKVGLKYVQNTRYGISCSNCTVTLAHKEFMSMSTCFIQSDCSFTDSGDVKKDLGHILDFITRAKHLKVIVLLHREIYNVSKQMTNKDDIDESSTCKGIKF